MKLTEDFDLEEFIAGAHNPDAQIVNNLRTMCAVVMQPVRDALGWPIHIDSGYRDPERNAAVGGVPQDDHEHGLACDFQVRPEVEPPTWEDATQAAWLWIAENCRGRFGQLIWEDHRVVLQRKGALWVHVSLVTAKHPGTPEDVNRLLFSYQPKHYHRATEQLFA